MIYPGVLQRQVFFSSYDRPTTYVSLTQVKTVVHASNIVMTGSAKVTTANPGASQSNAYVHCACAVAYPQPLPEAGRGENSDTLPPREGWGGLLRQEAGKV